MHSNYEFQRLAVNERINRPMQEAKDHRLARTGKQNGTRPFINILSSLITFPFRLIGRFLVLLQANKPRLPGEVVD